MFPDWLFMDGGGSNVSLLFNLEAGQCLGMEVRPVRVCVFYSAGSQ